MSTKRVAAAAILAAAIGSLPAAPASAQPCYYGGDFFPLFLPFGIAAAVVGAAATIVTLPFAALGVPPGAPVYPFYGPCAVPSHAPYYAYPPPPPAGPGGPPYTGYGYYGQPH